MKEDWMVKMDKAERYGKATKLRQQANELIEDKLPQMWNDGDVRYLDGATFAKIEKLMREATELEVGAEKLARMESVAGKKSKLVFRGQFGEIEIRDASKMRDEFKETE